MKTALEQLEDWIDQFYKIYGTPTLDDIKGQIDILKDYETEQLDIPRVSSRFYQVDFGNHLRCKLKVTDGKIEVEGAINGWGDGVPLEEVVILELNDC